MNTPENDPTPAAAGVGVDVDDELDEFSDEFRCFVCLDLIYKPVVLACGHLSCFWCVFKAMEAWQESRCPVCRYQYYHFPSICWLLHSVLLKLYPRAYQRRGSQVAEEEKEYGTSSPQFENYLAVSNGSEQISSQFHSLVQAKECSDKKSSETGPSDNNCSMGIPESSSDEITKKVVVEGICSTGSDHVDRGCKQISIADLLYCAICKELFYRPVVLNCGHVFCEACITDSCNELCRCPVCQSMHPNGFPKVCLVLVGFLEQHKSEEYAARRVAIEKVKTSELGGSSTGSTQVQQGPKSLPVSMDEYFCHSGHKIHYGVGCDCCGIYPLMGVRYKCKDCLEDIGFDLCEKCYNSSSNLPGRFNQQHKPDHKFEILEPNYIIVVSTDNPGDNAPDYPENPTNDFTAPDTPLDTQRAPESELAGPVPANDSSGDHEGFEPTS